MRVHKGHLFVISAPSGAGKTTLCSALIERIPSLKMSVSFTTRNPRSGEVHDCDYSFISVEHFLEMEKQKEFIERAEVYGNYYGTSLRRIEEYRAGGNDVLLDIDTQGARQIRERGIEGTFIFVFPPSIEILKERITGRKTDSEAIIQERLRKDREVVEEYGFYDYVIINDDLERALSDLECIVRAQRLRTVHIENQWVKNTFFR